MVLWSNHPFLVRSFLMPGSTRRLEHFEEAPSSDRLDSYRNNRQDWRNRAPIRLLKNILNFVLVDFKNREKTSTIFKKQSMDSTWWLILVHSCLVRFNMFYTVLLRLESWVAIGTSPVSGSLVLNLMPSPRVFSIKVLSTAPTRVEYCFHMNGLFVLGKCRNTREGFAT